MAIEQTVKRTIEEVRRVISRCTAPERDLLEELLAEAEGWDMRLDELIAHGSDDEEDE